HRRAAPPGAALPRAAASGRRARRARDRRRARGASRAAACARGRGHARHGDAPRAPGDMMELGEEDGVALIRMTYGKANAMSLAFCQALIARFKEVADAPAVV